MKRLDIDTLSGMPREAWQACLAAETLAAQRLTCASTEAVRKRGERRLAMLRATWAELERRDHARWQAVAGV